MHRVDQLNLDQLKKNLASAGRGARIPFAQEQIALLVEMLERSLAREGEIDFFQERHDQAASKMALRIQELESQLREKDILLSHLMSKFEASMARERELLGFQSSEVAQMASHLWSAISALDFRSEQSRATDLIGYVINRAVAKALPEARGSAPAA